MQNLEIKSTKNTPLVNLDWSTGVCEISGESFPGNSSKFWRPVFKWLNEYAANGNGEITFKFRLSNINFGSSKAIFSILSLLGSYQKSGINAKAFWYFPKNDLQFMDMWKELTEDASIPNFLVNSENIAASDTGFGIKIGKSLGVSE